MPLFSNVNNKLTMLNPIPLNKEKELQRLVETNLNAALEMHFLASEYMTSTGGRIDTLAVDSNGSPTIIEYKRTRDDNVINQALSYLKWLTSQRQEFFEMLMLNKLGHELTDSIKLDWRNPRVVCIAESFTRFDTDTVEIVPLRIDLYKYRYYENGLFNLEMVNANEKQHVRNTASQLIPVETNLGIIQAMKNQVNASYAIGAMFDELREKILGIDEYIVEKPGKRSIAYRLTKNFVEILIRKDKIVIDLRSIDFVDPRGLVEKIAEGYLVTLNKRLTLKNPADVDYVVGIIEQSYANVL